MSSSRWRDSDSASFYSAITDPLSSGPSNGYFDTTNSGPAPDIMFIDTEAANQGRAPKVTVSSATQYEGESTPLLETFVGQDAPPSYLEATTPIPWNGRPGGGEGERLLEGSGRASFEPMREEMHKDGKYRRRSIREYCTKRRTILGVGIVIIFIMAITIAVLVSRDTKVTTTPLPPSAQPAQSSTPSKPKENYPIRWPSRCGKDYNAKTEEINFGSPSELNIVESVHQLDGPYKQVSGWIHVAQAPSSQAAGTIQAKLSYAVSASVDVNSIKFTHSATGLTIGDPTFPDGFDGIRKGTACLGISIVLYMAPGAKMEDLDVRATHLGMQVHEGVHFAVTNQTSISLTTGTLDAASFSSRETRLKTISGSISGKYSLYDLVAIDTKSGSVNVNIEPMEAAAGVSPTALFLANSLSGSIRADFERRKIPERDYQISINTTVGSIDGTFIHGSKTTLSSIAGQITADLVPFNPASSSLLSTATTDGLTKIKLQSPYKAKNMPMRQLVSTHKSISGLLDVTYPQEWTGLLGGSSMNGTVHLQGRDLELLKQEEKAGFNMVEAKKGGGGSSLSFNTISGGCEVKIGKL